METVATDIQTDLLWKKIQSIERQMSNLSDRIDDQKIENSVSIVCFSGSWDKLFAALSISSGALALGMEVNLFFTFWSLSALRCTPSDKQKDSSRAQKMFMSILPIGFNKAPLSKFNFFGLGKKIMKKIMKSKGVDDIDTLFKDIKALGANIYVCDTSAELFGLNCSCLAVDKLNQCGSTTFLSKSLKSKMTLFI